MKGMEYLRVEFADEMGSIIEEIRRDLHRWEEDPEGPSPLQEILRGLHTVKGSSGLMELRAMADFCHQLEGVLGALEANEDHPSTPESFFEALENSLVAMSDALKALCAGEPYEPIISEARGALELVFPSEGAPKVTRLMPRPTAGAHTVPPPSEPPPSPFLEGPEAFLRRLDDAPGSPPPAETPSATERDMVSTLLRLLTVDDSGERAPLQRPPGQPTFNPLGFETSSQGRQPPSLAPLGKEAPQDPRRGGGRRQPSPKLVDDRDTQVEPEGESPAPIRGGQEQAPSQMSALIHDLTPPPTPPGPKVSPAPQGWPEVAVHRWPSPDRGLPLIGEQSQNVIRVDVQKLDTLLDLFGDLSQEHNRLARVREAMESMGANALTGDIAEIHRAMGLRLLELKDAVIRTRMIPIHTVFRRYPSMVESMAQGLGREVRLTIEGGDAEMDRSIIETLYQPLVHILRNAVSHGIEAPSERRRRNKPRRGIISLSAEQSGTMMSIEVKDDGKGLDPTLIAARALSQGLVSEMQLERMSDIERQNLIFMPGMTSSEEVTEVSGRGLGMDTVRAQLNRLGGRIEVESKVGEGAIFRLMVPLTLAIIQTVMARVGDLSFGIPASAILGVERGSRDNIHAQGGGWLLRRPNGPVPVEGLERILGLHDGAPPPPRCHVATLGVVDRRFAVWADRFDGLFECVIKPLTTTTTMLPGVLGGTASGTGDMTLILDPAALGSFFNKG